MKLRNNIVKFADLVTKLVNDLKKIKEVRTIILFGSYAKMNNPTLNGGVS